MICKGRGMEGIREGWLGGNDVNILFHEILKAKIKNPALLFSQP